MPIATYRWGGRRCVGIVSPDAREVTPLDLGERGRSVGALAYVEQIASGGSAPRPAGPRLPLSAVTLEAPIPLPVRNIFCAGVNYRPHAAEFARSGYGAQPATQSEIPEHPVIFTKVPDCVVAPGAPIELPPRAVSDAVDYEAELAVVIGRGGRAIAASRAMEHVFGYTIFNDVTARDLQRKHRQWIIGKSLDSFGPMGPWLVDTGELDGADTTVRCWVNGELRQEGHTRDLIFTIGDLIEAISAGITLRPGDIIATGTPAGVGIGFTPARFLKSGDVVRIEIDGIGVLENPVR